MLTDDGAPAAMVEALHRARHRRPRRGRAGRAGRDGAGTTVARRPPRHRPSRSRPRRRAVQLQRHLQAVRRDPGAGRRLARPAARRGPRAGRRERGRQEHAGQDPGRRPPARQRHDPARRRADRHHRAGPGPRPRDRGRPPGAAPVPRPDGRRERLHRPRAVRPVRTARLGRDRAAQAQALFEELDVQFDVGRAGPRPVDGRPAAHRDREGALGRGARPDPRRADRVAVRPRGRAAVQHRPPAARPRRRGPVRQPPPRRGLRAVRPRDRVPRRPPRRHDGHARAHDRRPGPPHGRPGRLAVPEGRDARSATCCSRSRA